MKTKVKLTFLVGNEQTSIYVEDSLSGIRFLEMSLTPIELSKILSRQSCVEVDAVVKGLDLVGKKHENKRFVFEIPKELYYYSNRDYKKLKELADSLLTDGWKSDYYFSSQDSFYEKDGKFYARSTIRRYI